MISNSLKTFRQSFKIPDKNLLRWFPGHMDKGIKQIQQKLLNVDCVVEIHDARIPISGRNPNFKSTICGMKPHILVLNKKDLADPYQQKKVFSFINKNEKIDNIVWTNCKNNKCSGLKKIIHVTIDTIKSSNRYHRSHVVEFNLMIIGVPNVGKSSFINMLRSMNTDRSGGCNVGAVAGITRGVMGRIKICDDPPIYVYDTPGILTPDIPNIEVGLKLALCSCLQDYLVGEDVIADYLLYWLNKSGRFNYVDLLGIDEPSDDITEVLTKSAVKMNKYKAITGGQGERKYYPDYIFAAKNFILNFRKGELGSLLLDSDMLDFDASTDKQIS